MEGFAELVTDFMSPNMVRLAGNELGINAFRDNPQVWSEKNINFAFREIFEKLLDPESYTRRKPYRDPTQAFGQIYSGTKVSNPYKINDDTTGAVAPFWDSDKYGRFELTYSTLTQYFGNDFYAIQPALYYREDTIRSSYGSRDLTLQHLVTSEFKSKIQHLYNKFYTVLAGNYKNNEVITAEFHVEGALGLGEGSRIDRALPQDIKDKFNDLLTKDQYSLSFVMKKQGSTITNEAEFREFVFSLTFYLVMFNAIVFIGDEVNGYNLFASQRKIYNNDYLTGLYPQNLPASTSLSQAGELIYNTMQAQWNEENGETVWNFEDCWPIYILDDARDLINVFKLGFGLKLDVKELGE
ncbi:hypothetical protein LCGC14_2020850 [marine sediment metagenome]|uniref:Uncharacterized protein n=1 Tax=marine sediment metagenome TaxID=412755 RepID=A0A0F9FK43_9ZZZZ